MTPQVTELPEYTEREGQDYYELVFTEPIDQENDEPLDTVNRLLVVEYGGTCTIDWRDEVTCWIWHGVVRP
jgi:hypothetical protein